MQHRDFIRSLSRQQRETLTARADRQGVTRLVLLVVILSVCSFWIVQRLALWPVGMVFQGLLLVSLFHLLHESIHDTPFATSWINRSVARFTGFVLCLPPTWFRYFHHAHHRYTQDPDRDPELQSPKPATRREWLLHVSGLRIWKSQAQTLLNAVKQPCVDDFVPERHRAEVRREMLLMLTAYALLLVLSLMLHSSVLLWVWLVPLLLGQPFLRLYLLAEHAGCEYSPDMFNNTRTVYSHFMVRWFTWNMPYHTEHHVYPTVPFHRLPELHQLMKEHLQHTEAGYIAFNRRHHQQLPSAVDATR